MFIVHIAGHLGKDPETRFTPSGQKVTSFNVATNQRKGKEDVTLWVKVTVWGDRFDSMISYLKKGSAVIVVGRMKPPFNYTDKEGKTQVTLEVTAEMIDFSPFGKSDRQGEGQSQRSQEEENQYQQPRTSHTPQYNEKSFQYANQNTAQGSYSQSSVDEDNLPF